MKRKRFRWVDPDDGKKYKLDVTGDFVNLIENVIITEEQAEDFISAYEEVCVDALHNIGHFISLISDPNVKADLENLFAVKSNIEPRQILNKPYLFSERLRNG